ncbi:hypothetical protein EGI11_01870 [Chryseobacterium sp. H3056]|uniref:Uncharacterized protein n=1 Tax=Kaistella daneshvariae TaxID=2487074 RepID=A0A3N0X0H0_9FLAO|nr:hypothetical protein EGI11_01870 [Kaistella daneshvariae]
MAKKYAAKTAKNLNHKRHKVLLKNKLLLSIIPRFNNIYKRKSTKCTKAENKIFPAFWANYLVLPKFA